MKIPESSTPDRRKKDMPFAEDVNVTAAESASLQYRTEAMFGFVTEWRQCSERPCWCLTGRFRNTAGRMRVVCAGLRKIEQRAERSGYAY